MKPAKTFGVGKNLSGHRRFIPPSTYRPRRTRLSPAELFVGSFVLLVILGTLLLKYMPGIYTEQALSWNDALFTSTSAICVTGLTVVDTATYFTLGGQILVLALIQLGGLGMLVLTSVIITALGGRPSLVTEAVAAGSRQSIPYVPARKLIADVVRFTLLFEMVGALLLFLIWGPRLGWSQAIWPAIFHSVSAFCNAGFSTYSTSLTGFQDSPGTIIIISCLIICGGLGFVTIEELFQWLRRSKSVRRRLSIHTRLVLTTSIVLVLGGWLLFAIFEWFGVLNDMTLSNKLSNALFMSITPRTAGFNTIDYGSVSDSSNFLTIILMMIGGSPGSTAGGMKTTTFALLGLLAWSRLRSNPTATFAKRSIPEETIQRAIGLFVIATGITVFGIFGLALLGDYLSVDQSFLEEMFEAVSAFNTVGLSMGITPMLSVPSRWLLIGLMFIGRTGPLAIASALVVRLARRGSYRLAYEDVIVG